MLHIFAVLVLMCSNVFHSFSLQFGPCTRGRREHLHFHMILSIAAYSIPFPTFTECHICVFIFLWFLFVSLQMS
jgi:hypothetical protein